MKLISWELGNSRLTKQSRWINTRQVRGKTWWVCFILGWTVPLSWEHRGLIELISVTMFSRVWLNKLLAWRVIWGQWMPDFHNNIFSCIKETSALWPQKLSNQNNLSNLWQILCCTNRTTHSQEVRRLIHSSQLFPAVQHSVWLRIIKTKKKDKWQSCQFSLWCIASSLAVSLSSLIIWLPHLYCW